MLVNFWKASINPSTELFDKGLFRVTGELETEKTSL